MYFDPATQPVQPDDTPLFDEVVRDLGVNPLDLDDPWHEEFNLASQNHAEASQALANTVRAAFLKK